MLEGLCISILTARRLRLLQATLASLDRADESILRRAHVIAYLNGQDEATDAWLRGRPYIDDYLYHPTSAPEPIGPAVSRIVERIPTRPQWFLHLEDDWEATSPTAQFLLDAAAILQAERTIGQVRLRLAAEPTKDRHVITGRFHPWEATAIAGVPCGVSSLHFTFNPSLLRVRDLPLIYPADSEQGAMRRFCEHGLMVAQLKPGVFRHLGQGASSLAAKLGRGARKH